MGLFRMRKLTIIFVALLAIVLFVSLPASAQDGPDPDTLALGARLYQENCAVCHGDNGEGRVGATLAKDWPAIDPESDLRNILVNGVPGSFMPPWTKATGGPFDETDLDAVVAYILNWQTGNPVPASAFPSPTARPPIEPVPDVEGDPNAGALLYDENCALCHGENGEGRIGATLAKDWPAIRPDLDVKNTINRGVQGSYMPPFSQENGGPLTEGDINNLVAFVLSWEGSEVSAPPAATPVTEPAGMSTLSLVIIVIVILLAVVLFGVFVLVANRPNSDRTG